MNVKENGKESSVIFKSSKDYFRIFQMILIQKENDH